ncbi:MAG: hypothetical protein KQJ78_18160 [Deltaproteobacteria bacterium]|nr:hypothetical protein [Deltaproteobacteria bacterium]
MASGKSLLVFISDALGGRNFFESGIPARLGEAGVDRLTVVYAYQGQRFAAPPPPPEVTARELPQPAELSRGERRRLTWLTWLNQNYGFMPVALRDNKHNFNPHICEKGFPSGFFNLDHMGPLPDRPWLNRLLTRFYLGWLVRQREPRLARVLEEARPDGVLFLNSQTYLSQALAAAALKQGLPVAGYIQSWDHPLGKGPILPGLARYIVQNRQMARDLEEFHGIPVRQTAATGWPQMDPYAQPAPKKDFAEYLSSLGLDPELPTVLFACNTPRNAPDEDRLLADIFARREEMLPGRRFNSIVRPHPKDRDRFEALAGQFTGVAVQKASFQDLGLLHLCLSHVDAVVCTGGTILIDAAAHDTPVVALYFDPYDDGREIVKKNFDRFHFRRLTAYGSYLLCHDWPEFFAGLQRTLDHPGELAPQRAQLRRDYVGELDGGAARRVAQAVAEILG